MFTFKKTEGKDTPNIDIEQVHSTYEMRNMRLLKKDDQCNNCKSTLTDGERCIIYVHDTHGICLGHKICPKEEDEGY